MSLRDDIVQACRTWLKAHADASALTDAQVKNAHLRFVVPQHPYLTVAFLGSTNASFVDGRHHPIESSTPYEVVGGPRVGTMRVQAFGEDAVEWLERARLSLATEAVMTTCHALGVAFQAGDIVPLNEIMPSSVQPRAFLDLRVDYRVRLATEVTPLESVDLDFTFTETGGTELALDATITLP